MKPEYIVEEDTHSRRKSKNTFSWSSTSSCFTQSTELTHESVNLNQQEDTLYSSVFLSEFAQLEGQEIKEKRIVEMLCSISCHGDIQTLEQFMTNETTRPFVNINAKDDEGTTPLIYASCFGKLEIVNYLLQAGANVDSQDKIGWTALMWATTNNHHDIVQILFSYSASSETKTCSGRTMYDLVDMKNDQMVHMLSPLTHTLQRRKSAQSRTSQEIRQEALGDDLKDCEKSFKSVHHFVWDQCLPDQMFVFAEQELDHVLDVAISHVELPMKTRAEIYVPVNIIFLSARFAHYFTSRELVHQLLSKAIKRIDHLVKKKSNSSDIHILAFWIANLLQLLYYLKKDAGLVIATAEHQLEMTELISETYTLLIVDSEKRLECILEPAMLEYEQIDGLESIHFADDWHRFFRRSRSSFVGSMDSHPSLQVRPVLSPQSIITLLTSILYVLQSYDVHPVIVIQATAQLFHFISCEIFNGLLLNKRYLCRTRGLQIRMNLTMIEEWIIREPYLPIGLNGYFQPIVQLVQLLQCVSQLSDLLDFITAVKSFELLNAMQVRRVVLNYRYEVSERRIPEEIEKYTMQIAQDTKKSQHLESFDTDIKSRPNSISSLGSLLIHSMSSKKKPDSNEEMEWKDSKYMLPFSLPTITNRVHTEQQDLDKMNLSDRIYIELKQKMDKTLKEQSIIPSIPEEWLKRLDHVNMYDMKQNQML